MDDVQYLKQHAVEEEYVCVIDSAKRDKSQYPTPQSYVVEFNAPFNHVFGIDVIDVTIPRSGYIIDTYNNTLYFRFDSGLGFPETYIEAVIPPGNYTDPAVLRDMLTSILKDPSDPEELGITCAFKTVPFDMSRKLIFTSNYSFELEASRSLASPVIGFAQPIEIGPRASQLSALNIYEEVPVLAYPPYGIQSYAVTMQRYLVQRFTSTENGVVRKIRLEFDIFGVLPEPGLTRLRLYVDRVTSTGNIPVYSKVIEPTGVGEFLLEYPQGNYYDTIPLTFNFEYALYVVDELNADVNNCWALRYGESDLESGLFTFEHGEYLRPYGQTIYGMRAEIQVERMVQRLDTTGVVDLFGERYIQLRCPEIEGHMHRNRAYERYNVGLALINTSREYETLNNRFVMLPTRVFHPIGKLKRMTLFFETSNGLPYNFNGIDHTITMIIRYYKIKEAPVLDKHILNPQYNMDYNQYLQDVVFKDRGEGSDDDSEVPVDPPRGLLLEDHAKSLFLRRRPQR
jgi:hypothetical protein